MKLINILRKIPYVNKKIKRILPNFEDVFNKFYSPEKSIVFLDIGANTGQTIDFVRRIYPKSIVYSFEPAPISFENLKNKCINLQNTFIYNIALADEEKTLDFYVSEHSATNSCLCPNTKLYKDFKSNIAEILEKGKKIEVQGITLDIWYEENLKPANIDIVKIDTQGYEFNVIMGGINTLKEKTTLLYFEIQYHDFYKDTVPFYKIFELLYENGFYYYCHLYSNKRNNYQILESDVLFVNSKFIKSFE